MVEFHRDVLRHLCRICGDPLALNAVKRQKKFYDITKAEEVLKLHYGISVLEETDDAFPHSACNKCRNKIDRLKKVSTVSNIKTTHKFVPHMETDCFCMQQGLALGLEIPLLLPEPVLIEPPEVVIDHSYAGLQGPRPGCSNRQTVEPRKKIPLKQANRTYIKQKRLKDIICSIDDFCEQRKEDNVDTMYAVLIQKLLDNGRKKEADRLMTIWNQQGEDELEMSATECLAMRVRTLQSKTRYRHTYSIQRDKTSARSLKPPKKLDAIEPTFMPGHCAFRLVKNSETLAEQLHELPAKLCEPRDIMARFKNFPADFPLPNVDGVEYDYVSAVAKTLSELDGCISEKLKELGLPETSIINTIIKDGGDGLGDVNVKTQKSDISRTDKVFRYSFCVIACSVNHGGEDHIFLFREEFPNSVDSTRPISVCHCDESDRPSISTVLHNISISREKIKNAMLELVEPETGKVFRTHSISFMYTMVDEKFERTSSGLQGSGSRYLCTLCDATTNKCQCDVGSFNRSRTYAETVSLFKYRLENPENLNENDLAEKCKGVNSMPLIISDATERSLDSTHANINIGRFFKKILVREIAEVYEWSENDKNRRLLQSSEKQLDEHLTKTLGLKPKLMMPGNYARAIFCAKNNNVVAALIKDQERNTKFKYILSLFSKMQAVYSSKTPMISLPNETESYQETALQFAYCLGEHFSYVNWSNYIHKVVEHVHEIIQDPRGIRSVGLLSSEGGESGNKLYRHIRRSLSRQDTSGDLRDALVFHWMYTSKILQKLASTQKCTQYCTKCGEAGHNRRSCDNDMNNIDYEL